MAFVQELCDQQVHVAEEDGVALEDHVVFFDAGDELELDELELDEELELNEVCPCAILYSNRLAS